MTTAVAEKIIRIDVVASANAQRNISAIAADMKRVENSAAQMQKSVSSGFGNLSSILGNFSRTLGAFGITASLGAMGKAVIDAATSYQVLEARLALVLGSTERASRATAQIADIAKTTGRELDGVAKLYEKASRSAQQFGISEDKVTQITLGFSQSIRLSGASTQEAYASLVQFGQALASGRLQGDEFRSLMENNSVFMYEFAKAAGVTVAELRKMGTDGKLNAKFLFDTMAKEGEDGMNMLQRLNKMAKEVPLTFSQSFNSVKTSAVEFTGELAKLFEFKSGDSLGFFGPLIRGITNLTTKIKEMKIESDALGEGFFARMIRLSNGITLNPISYGMEELMKQLGLVDKEGKPLAERIAGHTNSAAAELEKARIKLEGARKRLAGIEGRQAGRDPSSPEFGLGAVLSKEAREKVAEAEANFAKLESAYVRLRKAQSDISYGEKPDPFFGMATNKTSPDPDAERRQKAATTALNEFIQSLERERNTQNLLLSGREESKKSAGDLVRLEELLKEAHVSGNAAMAVRARLLIEQAQLYRDVNAAAAESEKVEAKAREEENRAADKIRAQILRDTEAIDALKNKSRATDEYTEAMLRMNRESAVAELNALSGVEYVEAARAQALRDMIALYDQALAKKAELMGARQDARVRSEQEKVDADNEKRIQSNADQINAMLKKGILSGGGGKSLGEQLLENLRETLRNKTIDIIINPVTSFFARALAELADQFSRMLQRSLFEALANSSSDPIGVLGNLLMTGFGAGMGIGGSGGSGVDYSLPSTGVRFGRAMGERFVPYDNFPASLHRGERVLTAQQNKEYTAGMSGRGTLVFSPVINVDSRADAAQVRENVNQAIAESQRAMLEEFRAQGVM